MKAMPLDPETRQKVRAFHLNVTLLGGLLMIAASMVAGYMIMFPAQKFPRFLLVIEKIVGKLSN